MRTPAVLVPLLVAASVAAGVRDPGAAEADVTEPITFGAPVRMPGGGLLAGSASEPSIALDSDGTIYITAACCLPVAASAWYSKDGGKTFRVLPSPAGAREQTVGAEGDFVVDEADRVILSDTRVASIAVTRWRDHGDTWERTIDATEVTVPLQDRPWLGWGGGSLYLYVNGGLQNTYVYESYDEGLTWNPVPVRSFSGNFPTQMTVNRQDGAIWLLGRQGFTNPSLNSWVSTDGGASWTMSPVAQASRGAVSPTIGAWIATDEAGNGYAVWSTYDGAGCDLEMSTSTDHGQSWSYPVKVNQGQGCATFPWIDAGLPGRVVVTWFHSDTKKDQSQMPGSATWHVQAAVSTNALDPAPSFAEARLPGVTVDRGTLTTGYGQSGGDTRSLLDFFESAVGPDGRFHISYAGNVVGGTWTWYVGQTGGPLLHANRIAATTEVDVGSAQVSGGLLEVAGTSTFKRAPTVELFPAPPELGEVSVAGGRVTRVGPDSDELLLTLTTLPNGTPGYDGLPHNRYSWRFRVGDVQHELLVTSRDVDGPKLFLDGKPIGGTIDGHAGEAIARVSLSAIGAAPGDTIRFRPPSIPVAGTAPEEEAYPVPRAAVTLSLRNGAGEVATGEATVSEDTATFSGALDVTGLPSGSYDLVATACYAGDCASTSTPVTL